MMMARLEFKLISIALFSVAVLLLAMLWAMWVPTSETPFHNFAASQHGAPEETLSKCITCVSKWLSKSIIKNAQTTSCAGTCYLGKSSDVMSFALAAELIHGMQDVFTNHLSHNTSKMVKQVGDKLQATRKSFCATKVTAIPENQRDAVSRLCASTTDPNKSVTSSSKSELFTNPIAFTGYEAFNEGVGGRIYDNCSVEKF
jgi:hypothetical protein